MMNGIYQVTVRGRRFESRDLKKLLARAVAEKRNMDLRLRLFGTLQPGALSGAGMTAAAGPCPVNAANH
jgi:hypothetical protein